MVRMITIKRDVIPGEGVQMKNIRIPDKGKIGLTRKEDKWAEFGGDLGGWRKDLQESARHMILAKVKKRDGYASTSHKLTQLANVTTDKETEIKARSDQKWLHNRYRG